MEYTEILGQIFIIISALTIFVNIITEVMKTTFATQLNTTAKINVFVLVLSELLTVGALVAYQQYQQIAITWYLFVAFLVVGVMVAYSAMFGYDKLMSYFSTTNEDGD